MCSNEPSAAAAAALLPYGLKPLAEGTAAAAYTLHPAITPAALEHYRLQLYNYAYVDRLRYAAAAHPAAALASPYAAIAGPYMPHAQDGGAAAAAFALSAYAKLDPRACYRMQEEPKPQHSYIGLIGMAILSSPEKKLVLSDIYQYILDNYSYFRTRGPGWRNSIRHNLSLNDCFIKAGRSANGKGHYWAIHPANLEDFKKGDFRRRKAQRRVRKHMGLAVPEDEESPSPPPPPPPPPPSSSSASSVGPRTDPPQSSVSSTTTTTTTVLPRKRLFDVESLLAPDPGHDDPVTIKNNNNNNNNVVVVDKLCDAEDDEAQTCTKDNATSSLSCSPIHGPIVTLQQDELLNEAGRKYSPDTTAPCWPPVTLAWHHQQHQQQQQQQQQLCPRKLSPPESLQHRHHVGATSSSNSPHETRWHETVTQFLRSSHHHHPQNFKLLKLGDV